MKTPLHPGIHIQQIDFSKNELREYKYTTDILHLPLHIHAFTYVCDYTLQSCFFLGNVIFSGVFIVKLSIFRFLNGIHIVFLVCLIHLR